MTQTLSLLLKSALARRKPLEAHSDAIRLVNGLGDGLQGLCIDRYNHHFAIQIFDPVYLNQIEMLKEFLVEHFDVEYLIVKNRSENASSTPDAFESKILIAKTDSKTIVEENDLRFEVDLNDGLNVGLFLDMRANRATVGKLCAGKRVLNCFAYTCSFGAYARQANAREVINCDISRKTLDRGKANNELNGFFTQENEFVRADALKFLERAVKKDNHFDVIILDPPSFSRHDGKTFQVQRDLPKLVSLAIQSLEDKGVLFVATNYSGLNHSILEEMLAKSGKGRKIQHKERLSQDRDFVGSGKFKESHLAAILAKF